MLSAECVHELRSSWLPNITDAGLRRLIELLEKNSPLLLHGAFTRAAPMGCLATQAAWNHPRTTRLTQEAGVMWLSLVAGLNPATSRVIREWDAAVCGHARYVIRQDLLEHLREEQRRRAEVGATSACELACVDV